MALTFTFKVNLYLILRKEEASTFTFAAALTVSYLRSELLKLRLNRRTGLHVKRLQTRSVLWYWKKMASEQILENVNW